jgi:hypothetical protein
MWVKYVKPISRRKGNYLVHLREVLAGLEQRGIPASHGNIRRLGCGRGPRVRAALAVLAAEAKDESATKGRGAQESSKGPRLCLALAALVREEVAVPEIVETQTAESAELKSV